MFSFLKGKRGKFPVKSKWSILKGEYEGHLIIVRRNDTAKQLSGNPDYKFRIGVSVALCNPDESGCPEIGEMKTLDQLEDALGAQMETDCMALEVMAITTNRMREFVFYSRSALGIEARLNAVRSQFPAYNLQSSIEEDPHWNLYHEFGRKLSGDRHAVMDG
jgi:hypothetical protein